MSSDRGVLMVRKLVRSAIERVRRGEDPHGVIRDPQADLIATTAGNMLMNKEEATR